MDEGRIIGREIAEELSRKSRAPSPKDQMDAMDIYNKADGMLPSESPSENEKELAAIEQEKKNRGTINHPYHYNTGKIEVIDFLEDQQLSFHAGNIVKYICRASHKGQEIEDLKKARWYLDRLIEKKERERRNPLLTETPR
jgi:Protein of unknwon function (DUF3310).